MSMDLKQLSSHLGLSPTTVSRALNGYADVSDATRQRVMQAAEQFGYRPNMAARRLALGRADAVGLVYPLGGDSIGQPCFQAALAGLTQRLAAANVDLLLATAAAESEQRGYERLVQGRRVDALVVPHTRVDDGRVDYLRTTNVPFLTYGRTRDAGAHAWVDVDHRAGAALAIAELLRLGHKRIGYVHAPTHYHAASERLAGWRDALQAAGLPADACVGTARTDDAAAAQSAARTLLDRSPRPTALLVDGHAIGVGALRACIDAGLALGRELSVIVFGQLSEPTMLPGLRIATVATPPAAQTGETIGELLLSLIGGQASTLPQVLQHPSYESGDTVGPAPH